MNETTTPASTPPAPAAGSERLRLYKMVACTNKARAVYYVVAASTSEAERLVDQHHATLDWYKPAFFLSEQIAIAEKYGEPNTLLLPNPNQTGGGQ